MLLLMVVFVGVSSGTLCMVMGGGFFGSRALFPLAPKLPHPCIDWREGSDEFGCWGWLVVARKVVEGSVGGNSMVVNPFEEDHPDHINSYVENIVFVIFFDDHGVKRK